METLYAYMCVFVCSPCWNSYITFQQVKVLKWTRMTISTTTTTSKITHIQTETSEFLHKWQPNTNSPKFQRRKKGETKNKTRNTTNKICEDWIFFFGKVVTTEFDHRSVLYELKFSARRVHESFDAMCNTVQMVCNALWFTLSFCLTLPRLFISLFTFVCWSLCSLPLIFFSSLSTL